MTGVFLQVRLDSSRLPRKALLDLGGRPVIVRAMEALDGVPADIRALVTTDDSRASLSPLASSCGWEIHCGSKDDVLSRYLGAASRYGTDTIIRATGDNPLVSGHLAALLMASQ